MEFSTFVRKPFIIEATEITLENIEEVADMIGTLRETENGSPYIAVDWRRIPNLNRVYPGFWVTQLGDNVRCYSKRIFRQQFVHVTPEIEDWIAHLEDSQDDVNVRDRDDGVGDINVIDDEEEQDVNVIDEEDVIKDLQ